MNRDWKSYKLKDIGTIFSGNSINAKIKEEKYFNISSGIPYIATKDISYSFEINYDNGISIPNNDIEKFKIAPSGSVIICAEGGSAGRKLGILNQDVCFVNKLFALTPDEKAIGKYIFYWYQSNNFQKDFQDKMTGLIGGVSKLKFQNIKIPIPSIEEQKQIVKILDKAFESIEQAKANIEKNIENTKELFQSRLNEIFSQKSDGWEEKTLKEVCTKITDGTHQTPKYFDSGYTFLSSGNVTSGIIDWDKIKYIDEKQHLEMQKRVSPQLNDILLAKNGTTGVAAMVDKDIEFDIYVSLALLRASDKLEAKYLLHFVNSPIAKKQFNKRLKGSGVPNLHLQEIREVTIPYPISKKEQLEISNYIELLSMRIKQLEKHYKQKLKNLEELKKSILQKAFSGELLNDS